MVRLTYREFDPEEIRDNLTNAQLRHILNQLLLHVDGDVEEAITLLKRLQERGVLPDHLDIQAFLEDILRDGIVVEDPDGSYQLSDKGIQGLRKWSLELMFRDLKPGGEGAHRTPHGGGPSQNEALPERRPFAFGDDPRAIDITESLWNTVKRTGTTDDPVHEEDLVVFDAERSTACATVLLLDVSHSMVLYGEDRFAPAKQVALALTELILTRFKGDTLDIVLFGDEAVPVSIGELPFVSVGPYHTNTKAGLRMARQILSRRRNPNKQIFMITDGKPTVIDVPGEGVYRNTWGHDERIHNRTLDEAVACRRKNIPITSFMITSDPSLKAFILELTERNRGRAYLSSPDRVGDFVFLDFIRNRRARFS